MKRVFLSTLFFFLCTVEVLSQNNAFKRFEADISWRPFFRQPIKGTGIKDDLSNFGAYGYGLSVTYYLRSNFGINADIGGYEQKFDLKIDPPIGNFQRTDKYRFATSLLSIGIAYRRPFNDKITGKVGLGYTRFYAGRYFFIGDVEPDRMTIFDLTYRFFESNSDMLYLKAEVGYNVLPWIYFSCGYRLNFGLNDMILFPEFDNMRLSGIMNIFSLGIGLNL